MTSVASTSRGDRPSIPHTFAELLEHRATEAAGETFMVCDEVSMTFVELAHSAHGLAERLVADGLVKGARVGVMMPNGIDWAVVAFAVLRAGAVLVPLSTLLRPPELLAVMRTADLDTLITVPEYRGRDYLADLDEALGDAWPSGATPGSAVPSLRRVWVWGRDEPRQPETVPPLPTVRPSDDAVVLFTSGSRGTPKGTIHTQASAIRAVASGLDARCVRPGERLYIPMPFFWAGGFAGGLMTALIAQATILTECMPSPESTIAFLEREKVTLFRGWPQQAARIAERPEFATADLSALRAGSLDAVLPAELRSEPGRRANLFGMTETLGPYAGHPLDTDLPVGKEGSCGRPFEGVELRIVDAATGAPLPPGQPGLIELRGLTLMRGICGRETHDVFTPDGYYPTGDAGYADGDGFFWYTGRQDDMFKVSGATVYPSEVEAPLMALPGVRQAFVVDVEINGAPAVAAAVVGAELEVAELVREAKARLSSFKVPSLWLVCASADDLPRLASDKIDKPRLQARLLSEGIRS